MCINESMWDYPIFWPTEMMYLNMNFFTVCSLEFDKVCQNPILKALQKNENSENSFILIF